MAKTATAPPLTASSAPQVDLVAQCATSPNGPFGFWLNVEPMNTVGTTSVRVQLLLDGVPFRTVTASQGLGITFPIGHAGVVSAVVGGVVVAEARSSTVPCGTGSAGVTLTGMCRDPAAGHEWLIGNFRAGTVDFDIRLNGAVIQTLTVASAGFVGFTTQAGGFAQAFAGGTEVASADSSEVPCVPTQATIAGRCFSPQPGYLWSVVNNTAAPITVDLVVAGTVPVVLALAPHELRYVFTHDGGDARLVRNGTVIAVAASEPFPCGGTSISLTPLCSDAASGSVWLLQNGGGTEAQVRLALNGVTVATVSLTPLGQREVSTRTGGRLEAFVGPVFMFSADSVTQPCAVVVPVCFAPGQGHVWAVGGGRTVRAEVRIGGRSVGFFDLHSFEEAPDAGDTTFASPNAGPAQVYINGILVGTAAPDDHPCVTFSGDCFDPGEGSLFEADNRWKQPLVAEVRVGGASLGVAHLGPFGFAQFASPRPGTARLYINGVQVATANSSNSPCDPAVLVDAVCSSGQVEWHVANQRALVLRVELRLDGQLIRALSLTPQEVAAVTTHRGVLTAAVNGIVVAQAQGDCEARSASLPATGSDASGALVVTGVVLVASGFLLLEITRRRSRPERS